MSINPINSFQQYQHPKKHKTLTPVSITGYAAGLFTLAHLIAIKLKHKKRIYR